MNSFMDFLPEEIEYLKNNPPAHLLPGQPPADEPDPRIEFKRLDELEITHQFLRTAVNQVRRWGEVIKTQPKTGLVLLGPTGTGKTHIALSILSATALYLDGQPVGYRGVFMKSQQLMIKLTPSYNQESHVLHDPHPREFIPASAPVVVLDEVGGEKTIPFVAQEDQTHEIQSRLYQLIDYIANRKDNPIPLVITCNLNRHQLEEYVGVRCWSRLKGLVPPGFWIDFASVPDYREITGKKNSQL